MSYNSLGLDKAKIEKVANALNTLLANYQTYYQNLRGVHWNIKELYNAAQVQVDEIAERILTLGGVPFHTFNSYVKNSTVPVGENIFDDEKTVRLIADSISELLKIEREILSLADDANDEGTTSLISDLVTEQEKNNWMLKAYLNETI